MFRSHFKTTIAVAIVWAMVFSLAGISTALAKENKKIQLGILQMGAQDFIHQVMEDQKILAKHDILYDRVLSLSPPSLHLMIAEKKVDIGFGGLTSMATARLQGKGTIVIYGIFSPANVVVVPKDSPIKSLKDLKGKKYGVFGGPGSATTSIFLTIAKRWHGVDLKNDAKMITARGPALLGFLDQGEVAAALVGTTDSLKAPLTGKYRVLLDLSDEWEKRAGRAPSHVTIATNETFAKEHPDILKRYLAAYLEAVEYVRTHDDVWVAYAKRVKFKHPRAAAILKEKMLPRLVTKWDAEQIKIQQDFLEAAKEILGPRVLKEIPKGLMTNAYNP